MGNLLHAVRSVGGWVALGFVGSALLCVMPAIPNLERRRRLTQLTARLILTIFGVRLRVVTEDGSGQALPLGLSRGCVIVANHTTYLDGLILTAALPPYFAFVIKKEMTRVPMAGWLLRLIGSEFVDRFNRHQGAMDARRVMRRVSSGHSIVFFPEGTFSKQPGLLRFHTGAFATAVRAGCPIVPVVIHGARELLPYNRLIAKPGTIEVEVLSALEAAQDDANAAADLKDRTRAVMLDHLGEPDLAASSHVAPVLTANLVEGA